ncbi:MAG: 50S ribosomal protein L29 [Firmicutes bacterium]|nr:50S ribosomal protein L29 [Bacillota bacterium]
MKANEVHEMTNAELNNKLDALKSDLFYLRFNHATGNLSNPGQLSACKKDIARVLTVLRERQIKGVDVAESNKDKKDKKEKKKA